MPRSHRQRCLRRRRTTCGHRRRTPPAARAGSARRDPAHGHRARGGHRAGAATALAPECSRGSVGGHYASNKSRIAAIYRGPPARRSLRAHQRRLAVSRRPAGRQHVDERARSEVIHDRCRYTAEALPRGCRRAGRGRGRKRANGLQSTSERTRWGWLAASSMTGSADSADASTDARFAADRVEHGDEPVGPGLHRGMIVDRHRVGAPEPDEGRSRSGD